MGSLFGKHNEVEFEKFSKSLVKLQILPSPCASVCLVKTLLFLITRLIFSCQPF